jgi:hypothetical protein
MGDDDDDEFLGVTDTTSTFTSVAITPVPPNGLHQNHARSG